MVDERTYREDEVSEIFELASSAEGAILPVRADPKGLTLAELQEVGAEVGLSPERVAAAAAAVQARLPVLPRKTWMGYPVGVGRVVELPRAATDHEWQILLGDLRQTFHAYGQIERHEQTREWSNGNLHAFLEPTEAGHRLRMGTQKGGSKETTVMGAVAAGFGLLLLVTSGLDAATFGTTFESVLPALMALGGGGMLAGNFLRLKNWAAKREAQMEYIGARARALLAAPPDGPDEVSRSSASP